MKYSFYRTAFLFTIITIFLGGCQKDDSLTPPPSGGTDGSTTVNNWIDGIMRDKYLWYGDIPGKNTLDYSVDPALFFKSMLSGKERGTRDGYYSTIEKTATSARGLSGLSTSYGIEYVLYSLPNSEYYTARVLYVLPKSPAKKAGIKRGDWIIASNGKPITTKNYAQLLSSGGNTVFSTMVYDKSTDNFLTGKDITVPSAREVENNPIFLDTVYVAGSEKIGYLVYNSFLTGKNGFADKGYTTEMVKCFEQFKAQNINYFILDLRYNGGGYINCSQWLGTGLAPASALNRMFAYTMANDKQKNRKEILPFIEQAKSANLNLSHLYVITSGLTASASETVINSLRAYMDITLIGTQTEGKNVGGTVYENNQLGYTITPITFKVYNSLDQSDFSEGFVPNYIIDEMASMERFLELGDTNEWILSKTLSLITGITPSNVKSRSVSQQNSLKISHLHSFLRYGTYGKLLKYEE